MSTASPAPAMRGPFLAIWSALTIFVSAFLLFQVQPIISKTILPWFGGTPAVWTTCMLFFQVLLLGGYAYAHALNRFLPINKQGSVHAILLVLGLLTLPINPSDYWKPANSENPSLQILVLLLCKVGVPYLLLASTGPLVQSWFAKLYLGRSPFRLYALSNVGSLGALLSYPFVIETVLSVKQQGHWWSLGFAAFATLAMVLGWTVWRLSFVADPQANKTAIGLEEDNPPSFLQGVCWTLLAALASLTFLAVTNHVCQDTTVVPFLWVVPLSLYLLTFIICFDSPRWYSRRFCAVLGFLTICLLVSMEKTTELDKTLRYLQSPLEEWDITWGKNADGSKKVLVDFPVTSSVMGNAALRGIDNSLQWLATKVGQVDVVSSEDEETAQTDSEVSEEGTSEEGKQEAQAAVSKTIVPRWGLPFRMGDFDDSMFAQCFFYFSMLFLVCMMCHGELVQSKPSSKHLTMFYMLISFGGALGGITVGLISPYLFLYQFELPLAIIAGFMLCWIVMLLNEQAAQNVSLVRIFFFAGVAIMGASLVYATVMPRAEINELTRRRNFFGTISVRTVMGINPDDVEAGEVPRGRALYHGRILHGFQYITPNHLDDATTYYADTSGAGLSVQQLPREANQPLHVAVVGLGAGTMASHARFGDRYRFYDIDPKVIALSNEGIFTFVSRAKERGALVDIVEGDARISMEREAKEKPEGLEFDVLVLDAFSGDAIPAHLLTEEAMQIYETHMRKGADGKATGIIAIHISNRFIDLKPVVASLAEKFDYPITLIHDDDKNDQGDTSSEWVLLTRNVPFMNNWSVKAGSDSDVEAKFARKVRWTDQQSNLFEILKN